MAVNCLLLFSTILYFLTFFACLCVISALALAKRSLNGRCKLYVDPDTALKPSVSNADDSNVCDFAMYVPICAAVYTFSMGVYHGYALYVAFKETHIGRTMWVMPWMLVNSLMFIITLCASASFSIGFALTCSKFAQTHDAKTFHFGCEYVFDYGKGNGYKLYNVAQVSTWLSVVLLAADFTLTVIRFIRNRRARSTDLFIATSDRNPIALATPTA